ncbi:autotransporter (plasmid) [Fusobacterium varium]|nr:autotransporter [Fusobacterium varium]
MKQKILLLGALFIVLTTSVSANLEITEDFINDEGIIYENAVDNEKNIFINEENIEVINSGIISVTYKENNVTGDLERVSKGNGINTGVNSTIDNNGVIMGNLDLTGGTITATRASIKMTTKNSGNGIHGDAKGSNNGIILGDANIEGGIGIANDPTTASYSYTTILAENTANGIYGNFLGNNSGIILGNATIIGGTGIADSIIMNSASIANTSITARESANGINMELLGNNSGTVLGSAVITGGNTMATQDISIAKTEALSRISTFYTANGINSNLSGNNSGLISGATTLIGGKSESESTSDTYIFTQYSANGISGELHGNNTGTVLGHATIIGGESIGSANTSATISVTNTGNGILGGGNGNNSGIISGNVVVEGGKASPVYQTYNSYSNVNSGLVSSGNGIKKGKIEENSGLILGSVSLKGGEAISDGTNDRSARATVSAMESGNGLLGGNLNINNGTISGYVELKSGIFETNSKKGRDIEYITRSGNGVANGRITFNINNNGLIKGSQSAISGDYFDEEVNNYGVMAGRKIFGSGSEEVIINDFNSNSNQLLKAKILSKENNYGTYIELQENLLKESKIALDIDGDAIIENIIVAKNLNNDVLGINNSRKTILNATVTDIIQVEDINKTDIVGKDSYITIDSDKSYSDHIINGAGIKNAVLTVEENVTMDLKDSIVNGYKTAVSLNNNSIVTASDTIFNGGGLKNEDAVINIKGNNAALTIDGKSVINGLTTISGKDSIVNIGNEVIINGDIKSEKDKNNILNLGDGTQGGELRLFHEIDGFTTINTSGKVIAYETAKILSGDIHIKDGSLLVRLDGTQVDDQGRIKGHALYDHKGSIILELGDVNKPSTYAQLHEGAQIIFKASGLGVGTIISMNGTDITNLYDLQIGTHSSVHTAIKHQIDGELTGDVEIAVKTWDDLFPEIPVIPEEPEIPTIPETPGGTENPGTPEVPKNNEIKDKDELGEIYDSIVKGDQLPILGLTTDLEDKTKEESLKELVSLLDQIYANNPYSYGGEMSYESLRLFTDNILKTKMPELSEWIVESHGIYGYDKFDKVRREHKVAGEKLNINYSRELTTTGLLGTAEYGIAQNSSLGVAVGGTKQKLNMHLSDVKGNLGYVGIYGKRRYENFLLTGGLGYQYGEYDVKRVIENNYQRINTSGEMKTNSMSGYIEGKYTIEAEKGTKIEPKVKVTYSYIKQDKVKEKTGSLSIDMDKKSYLVPEMEVGVDISKEIKTKSGKVNTTAGISYVRVLGKDNTKLTGRMKDSTDFKVKGPNFKESKLRLEGRVEYEQENGIFYNASLGMDIGNKKEKEVNARVGIGYRF